MKNDTVFGCKQCYYSTSESKYNTSIKCPICSNWLHKTDIPIQMWSEENDDERKKLIMDYFGNPRNDEENTQYALSFSEFYEYDVVTITNVHGKVDSKKIKSVLMERAKKGWRLHTMYSNELGKNALMVMGLGTNSTACEDVMIFERRIQKLDDYSIRN